MMTYKVQARGMSKLNVPDQRKVSNHGKGDIKGGRGKEGYTDENVINSPRAGKNNVSQNSDGQKDNLHNWEVKRNKKTNKKKDTQKQFNVKKTNESLFNLNITKQSKISDMIVPRSRSASVKRTRFLSPDTEEYYLQQRKHVATARMGRTPFNNH